MRTHATSRLIRALVGGRAVPADPVPAGERLVGLALVAFLVLAMFA